MTEEELEYWLMLLFEKLCYNQGEEVPGYGKD